MNRLKPSLSRPNISQDRERLLQILVAATFLIFFQAYMVAPLIPSLATTFHVSHQTIGLIVPAYLIPYGIGSLVYGILSDWIGRQRIMLTSLLAFILLTACTAIAPSASQLILWRFITGLCASGVIPLALTLMGSLFPYEQRGRPMGWIFGAMAGGMAFGSTFGALLEPLITWRGIFLVVSLLSVGVWYRLYCHRQLLGNVGHTDQSFNSSLVAKLGWNPRAAGAPTLKNNNSSLVVKLGWNPSTAGGSTLKNNNSHHLAELLITYKNLLGSVRGGRTYAYVLLNGIFHSGVYTWLGLYFHQQYGLGEAATGLALLGYGVPGFLFGPLIGRAADRWGRNWLIPIGFGVAGTAAALLIFKVPLMVAAIAVTLLSLGYDMTQPLLAGIVTVLGGKRGGQAMGLNVFILFIGFGIGSFLFGELVRLGFPVALLTFATTILVASLAAIPLFQSESFKPTAQTEKRC